MVSSSKSVCISGVTEHLRGFDHHTDQKHTQGYDSVIAASLATYGEANHCHRQLLVLKLCGCNASTWPWHNMSYIIWRHFSRPFLVARCIGGRGARLCTVKVYHSFTNSVKIIIILSSFLAQYLELNFNIPATCTVHSY